MALRKTMQEYVQKTGRKPSPEYERRFIAFFAAPDTDISEPDRDETEIPLPEGNQQ